MTSHRVHGWGSAALVLGLSAGMIAASGCSDDTSLLIRVTRDSEVRSLAELHKVEVFVGIAGDIDSGDRTRWFVGDPDPEQRVLIDDRDLLEDPLTVMLKPGDRLPGDAELFVAAVASKADGVVVGIGAVTDAEGSPRTVRFVDDTVVKYDVVLRPPVQSDVEVSDQGCLRWNSPDGTVIVTSPEDRDCDDDPNATDCAPDDPNIHHGATDDCTTDADEDCDGDGHNPTNRDGDRFTNCDGDCDDNNPNVFPGAPDRCDGVDNDCQADTACDPDPDEDTYTICGKAFREEGRWICQLSNLGDDNECGFGELCDCREGDKNFNPGAPARCDGEHNDCRRDTACDPDPDGDGYTVCGTITWTENPRESTCEVTNPGGVCPVQTLLECDCNERDATAIGGAEVCDGFDNGCDGVRYQERTPCFGTADGMCFAGERRCDDTDQQTPFEECVINRDGGPVSGEFCARYAECADDPDPYRCMTGPLPSRKCAVDVVQNIACQPAVTDLPAAGITGCQWRILGGQRQGPWTVGLRRRGTDEPLSDRSDSCLVAFVVDRLEEATPTTLQRVVIARHATGVTDLIEVELTAETVEACTPGAGMQCGPSTQP